MAAPVWQLSVDLQTKTAVFQSGMAEAARSAKNAFTDIKQGSEGMADGVSYNMTEARHGVMLLGEEFGVHIPRALVSFISQLGPVSAAMEAAFPFLAIIVGATLLIEHLAKLKEAGVKLTESQVQFGTTTANVLNGLNDKLLQAGIKADELNHNHLAALNKQLELIDHVSMNELVAAFGTISKAADELFKQMEKHWYQFGSGSAGAKSSLDRFKGEYDSLLAKKDSAGATKLLDETIAREEKILALQKQRNDSQADPGQGKNGDYNKFVEASIALKKLGVAYDKDAVASQETLVKTLRDQASAQAAINELAKGEKGNAKTEAGNKIGADGDKAFRVQAEAEKHAAEDAQKAWEENYKEAVSALQENERLKIAATETGSRDRLAAINAAIREEETKGLQETGFYKGLLTSRAETIKQMGVEEDKLKAQAKQESTDHQAKMDELANAAIHEQAHLKISAMRNSEQARLDEAKRMADAELAIGIKKLQKEANDLDKTKGDYDNKLKALQNREEELIRAHANKITQITMQAEEGRNARLISAAKRRDDAIASSMSNLLNRHASFSQTMISLGDQVASGMIQNAIKAILANDMTKPSDAASAARKAFNAGMKFPFPVNLVMGPALGAMAFASVMAFEKGGIVPGNGNTDSVPAMLTPGEGVIPKKTMEHLGKGDMAGGGSTYHVHVHSSPTVHALDADGMSRVMDKHSDLLAQKFNSHLRKMNK